MQCLVREFVLDLLAFSSVARYADHVAVAAGSDRVAADVQPAPLAVGLTDAQLNLLDIGPTGKLPAIICMDQGKEAIARQRFDPVTEQVLERRIDVNQVTVKVGGEDQVGGAVGDVVEAFVTRVAPPHRRRLGRQLALDRHRLHDPTVGIADRADADRYIDPLPVLAQAHGLKAPHTLTARNRVENLAHLIAPLRGTMTSID